MHTRCAMRCCTSTDCKSASTAVRMRRTRRCSRGGARAAVLARRVRALERKVAGACGNVEAVRTAVRAYRDVVPRSSGGVESLNSQLRVTQMVHRTVPDELLWLLAYAWNCTPREAGSRKGKSPYELLGIEQGPPGQRWTERVLDAIPQAKKAA